MMRPTIVTNGNFIYYPIRKAASSSIQYYLGNSYLLLHEARERTAHHFTVWRPPHTRFASLYIGSVNPAHSGFYQPWARYNIKPGMPFDAFIKAICNASQDALCDEHLIISDWPRHVDDLHVYDFNHPNTWPIQPQFIGTSYAAIAPSYTEESLRLVHDTFAYEYATYPDMIKRTSD